MTIMMFHRMLCVVPNMEMWAAFTYTHTFCVSRDNNNNGQIIASIKMRGARPFDGGRLDLGEFSSVEAAMQACMNWKEQ